MIFNLLYIKYIHNFSTSRTISLYLLNHTCKCWLTKIQMVYLPMLYTLTQLQKDDTKGKFKVSIDPNDEVFKGHFSSQPVLPGVLILRMAVDAASLWIGYTVHLDEIIQTKFLHFVDPSVQDDFTLELEVKKEDNRYYLIGVFSGQSKPFTKLNLVVS